MTSEHDGDRPAPEAMRRFRRVAASFATGVVVVTTLDDDVPLGTTVNAFTTVSLDPTMLLVCLGHGSRLLPGIEHSGVFAATVLAAEQLPQARWFANKQRPTGMTAFAGVPSRPAPATGCLLLTEGLAYFDCQVRELYPGGDHAVVLGEVLACGELSPGDPLLFVGGGYHAVDPRGPIRGRRPGRRAGHGVAAPVDSSSGAGRSTSANAWSVTTRR